MSNISYDNSLYNKYFFYRILIEQYHRLTTYNYIIKSYIILFTNDFEQHIPYPST